MDEVTLEIDGREVKAEKGKTILEAAKKAGIHIPTLCYYSGLPPAGVCRLCSVEITKRGRKRIVTACCYPVEEGLVVSTKSPEVVETRKMLIELMLARCPNVKILQDLAKEYGVGKPRFKLGDEKCILCGLCERVCNKIGKSVINFVGRGVNREVKTPYQISLDADLDFCMSCGACVSVCPTGAIEDAFKEITKKKPIPIPSEFEMGLTSRKPVYLPFPYAVPNVPTIDREKCAHFATGECRICEEICDANAIDFEQKEELIELEVGAIVVATGFDPFDPSKLPEYGYGKYPGVITGLEFERLSSASGPTGGEIVINGRKPKRVAFISCVGSRTKETNPYCSRVCCMYTAKHAHLVKEKLPEAEVMVYYTDVRTFGKGYEEFYDRVKNEGVKYKRRELDDEIKVSKRSDRLVVEAKPHEPEEVDLVVLASAIVPSSGAQELAKILNVSQGSYGFFMEAHPKLRPVETLTDGIFLAGCAQSPKDIPDTVAQASASAAEVCALLTKGTVMAEGIVASVNENLCTGCGFCAEVCPIDAIELKTVEKKGVISKKAKVNEALCKGCGICSAACLSGAIQQRHFEDKQVLPLIDALGEQS